jgi:hypothetical protein
MTAAEIAAALGGAHREGRNWRCRCSLHGGHSLTLHDGRQCTTVALLGRLQYTRRACRAAPIGAFANRSHRWSQVISTLSGQRAGGLQMQSWHLNE